jgi:hypothetical protein
MGRGAGGGKGGDQGEHAARHTYRTQSRARVSQALTHVRQAGRWATLGGPRQLAVIPKVGAGWGSASRPDLCRGCRVTGIPTAIGAPLLLRRITVALHEPTRDGDTEIHVLSHVPMRQASAQKLAESYGKRWTSEISQPYYGSRESVSLAAA